MLLRKTNKQTEIILKSGPCEHKLDDTKGVHFLFLSIVLHRAEKKIFFFLRFANHGKRKLRVGGRGGGKLNFSDFQAEITKTMPHMPGMYRQLSVECFISLCVLTKILTAVTLTLLASNNVSETVKQTKDETAIFPRTFPSLLKTHNQQIRI
jgi:hypothetical protein